VVRRKKRARALHIKPRERRGEPQRGASGSVAERAALREGQCQRERGRLS
jgi:hypothetical protein